MQDRLSDNFRKKKGDNGIYGPVRCCAQGHRSLQPQGVFGSQEKFGLEVCRRRKSHNYTATIKG